MSEDNGKKNIVFVVGDSVTRAGADEDVKTIVSTFEKLYNATVYVELDREPDDYKPFFSELKTDETWLDRFAKCDFVAIFCLVHGTSNGISLCGGEAFNYKTLFLNPFFKIQQLNGKLKWLVLQACRGSLNDLDVQFDNNEEMKIYVKHFLISYCTGEGTVSYQFNDNGKVYIQSICKQLCKNAEAENYDRCLIKMLQDVGKEVEQSGDDCGKSAYSRPEFHTNIDSYKFRI